MKKIILRFNILVVPIICLSLLTACGCSKPKNLDGGKSTDSNINQEESYKTLTIISESMRPVLVSGDVIYYDIITESTQLKQYDIVVYSDGFNSDGEKKLLVSRIIEINTDSSGNVKSYTTKGDYNIASHKILPEDIVGIYVSTKSHRSN